MYQSVLKFGWISWKRHNAESVSDDLEMMEKANEEWRVENERAK